MAGESPQWLKGRGLRWNELQKWGFDVSTKVNWDQIVYNYICTGSHRSHPWNCATSQHFHLSFAGYHPTRSGAHAPGILSCGLCRRPPPVQRTTSLRRTSEPNFLYQCLQMTDMVLLSNIFKLQTCLRGSCPLVLSSWRGRIPCKWQMILRGQDVSKDAK